MTTASSPTGRRSRPDSPTYVRALREAGYHTALAGQGPPLPRREALGRAHGRDGGPARRRSGFAEVFETGDKFMPKIPTRYSDYLATEGWLEAYAKHLADRSLPRRQRGRPERHQVRARCGTRRRCPSRSSPTSTPGTARKRCAGSRSTSATRPSSCSSGSPGRMTLGTPRRRRWHGTTGWTSPCRPRRSGRWSRGRAATARCCRASCGCRTPRP